MRDDVAGEGRRPWRVSGWLAALVCLAALTFGFHHLTGPSLAAPPWQPSAFAGWLTATDPTVAVMSLLRLVVLGLGWYLLGVTSIGGVARLLGAVRLIRLADAVTVPAVRRTLQSALGLGLATVMVGGPASATARAEPLPLQLLQDAGDAHDAMDAGPQESGDAHDGLGAGPQESGDAHDGLDAGPQESGDARDGRDAGTETAERGTAAPAAPAVGAPAATAGSAATEHVVVAGESFWSIAADRVAASRPGQPTEADVAGYWRALIEQNRDRLADRDNPDLVFPGQRFVLPALDGEGEVP